MSAQIKEVLEELLKRLHNDVVPAFEKDPDYGKQRISSWSKNCNRQLEKELHLPKLANKLTALASMRRSFFVSGYTDSDHFFEHVLNRIHTAIQSLILDIENKDFDINEYKEELPVQVAVADKSINLENRKCFIVHGRDDSFKLEVARHLERKSFQAIILHEQPSGGRTVIEKLMKYAAECEFAIVLYTPDDKGALVDRNDLQKRARQNVIFEHGLTIGLMGKSRVFPIVSDHDIEKPNDISGVVYITKDNWKSDLDEEIKALGYTL